MDRTRCALCNGMPFDPAEYGLRFSGSTGLASWVFNPRDGFCQVEAHYMMREAV